MPTRNLGLVDSLVLLRTVYEYFKVVLYRTDYIYFLARKLKGMRYVDVAHIAALPAALSRTSVFS